PRFLDANRYAPAVAWRAGDPPPVRASLSSRALSYPLETCRNEIDKRHDDERSTVRGEVYHVRILPRSQGRGTVDCRHRYQTHARVSKPAINVRIGRGLRG